MVHFYLYPLALHHPLHSRLFVPLLLCLAHLSDAWLLLSRLQDREFDHCHAQCSLDQSRWRVWNHCRHYRLVEHAGWSFGAVKQLLFDPSLSIPVV